MDKVTDPSAASRGRRVLCKRAVGTIVVGGGVYLLLHFTLFASIPGNEQPVAVTLILVDVQQDFWNAELAEQHPNFQRNVAELVNSCRTAGIEIVHIRTSYNPKIDNWSADFVSTHRSSRLCVEGTDGALALDCAKELPGEKCFYKGRLDGFTESHLAEYLIEAGTSDVMIAGLYTDVCVFTTALAAFNRGYRVTLVEDCCAAPRPAHEFIINRYDGFILNCLSHVAIRSIIETSRPKY